METEHSNGFNLQKVHTESPFTLAEFNGESSAKNWGRLSHFRDGVNRNGYSTVIRGLPQTLNPLNCNGGFSASYTACTAVVIKDFRRGVMA